MSQEPTAPSILQLRVVIRGISPLIWRRLLVSSDTTIADLHGIMQTVLGWSDEYLHYFRIHGKDYGVSHDGGIWFSDDPDAVRLNDFRLRSGERFVYVYNLRAHWQCDMRLEAVLPANPRQRYPACTGGRRAAPPEEYDGPWDYLERMDDRPFPFEALQLMAKTLRSVKEARGRHIPFQEILGKKQRRALRCASEQVAAYYAPEQFDRGTVNEQLHTRAWESPRVVYLGGSEER